MRKSTKKIGDNVYDRLQRQTERIDSVARQLDAKGNLSEYAVTLMNISDAILKIASDNARQIERNEFFGE